MVTVFLDRVSEHQCNNKKHNINVNPKPFFLSVTNPISLNSPTPVTENFAVNLCVIGHHAFPLP